MSKKDKVKKKSHFKISDVEVIICNQKDIRKRNVEYISSYIQENLMNKTIKNVAHAIFNIPIGCNLFLDGPKDVPEYYYVTFKNKFGDYSNIYIKNVLFRNINIDDVIKEEIVPIMAAAIYRFSDGNKKYGILENEVKSEYLFSTFYKIIQKIKEMLENGRLSIRDFEDFKKLFEVTIENQLEHYPDAKEKLFEMESTLFIVGLDQKVVDEIEKYKQECAKKKKKLEAKLGHEVSDNTFYLIDKFGEQRHESGRAEGLVEGEQKKEKEMIFKMFSDGLDDKTVLKYSSYSVEDIAKLREEWKNANSSENTD